MIFSPPSSDKMDSTSKTLERFRVPKKKNKEPLELLPPNSEQTKIILNKLQESFKKPDLSRQFMKFHRFWSINVPDSESRYIQRRSAMKGSNSKSIESFGFVFIRTENELRKLVKDGQLRINNISRSHLGNPQHAVSVSQHADICQPDPMKSGMIVLVKYIKGRVKYVDFADDQSQLDPQPDFDCHLIRNSVAIDSSSTTYEAFHLTQVYIYEYDDDVNIKEFPSQILIYGAVHFSWHGGLLYRDIAHKDINITNSNSIRLNINTLPPQKPVKRTHHMPLDVPAAKKIHINIPINVISKPPPLPPPINFIFTQPPPPVPVMLEMITTKLIIGKPPLQASMNQNIPINLNIKLLTLLREPLMISNLLHQNWYLSEMLPTKVLEEYLSLDNKGYPLNPCFINTFPQTFNDRKKMGATFRPKYATHLFMVSASDKDRKVMESIISKLTSTNRVGVIHCNALCNILFYVFPNGKVSRYLSLQSMDTPYFLHAILLTEQHPQCLLLTNDKSIKKEQKIFQDILTAYEDLNRMRTNTIIPVDVLKRNLLNHQKRQKQYFEEYIKSLNEHPSPMINEPSDSNQKNNDSDMDVDNFDNDNDITIIKNNSINNNHKESFSGTKTNKSINNSTTTISTSSVSTIDRNLPLLNNAQLDRNLDPLISQVPIHLENNRQGLSVPISNGIVPISHPSVSIQSLPQDITPPELVISSTPKYYGRFTLIRVPNQSCIKPPKDSLSERIQYTKRRPVHLDSVIFEQKLEHSHITIYNGEF